MLTRLILQNYRNFSYSQWVFDHPLVLIHGANGVGKTNILEAISLLSAAKGLRCTNIGDLGLYDGVQHQDWTLFYDLSGETAAIQSLAGKKTIRLNNKVSNQKQLLGALRVFWVSPENDRLFAGAPAGRRQFINQLIEIISPDYADTYRQYMHLIQERSQILRAPGTPDSGWMDTLEAKIVDLAMQIYKERSDFIEMLNGWIGQLVHFGHHRFEMEDGFYDEKHQACHPREGEDPSPGGTVDPRLREDDTFIQTMRNNRTYDQIHGGSKIGPHKSDLKGYRNDMPLSLCSNGQQCIGLMSILLGLIKHYSQQQPVIFLIDEIFSHLDAQHQELLLKEIHFIPQLQTFLTLPHAMKIQNAQIISL